MFLEMGKLKILDGFVANGLRVGRIKHSEEFNVGVFSLIAEPVGIVGKNIGTALATKVVLVPLYALGDHNSLGRANQPGFFLREELSKGKAEIDISFDAGMEGENHT